MNVLFMPGIICPSFVQGALKRDLHKHPQVQNVLIRTDFYLHTQTSRCKGIVESLKHDITNFTPDIIIAHSFGGLLVKKALSELKNHSVQVYCSLGSPHTMLHGMVATAKQQIGIPSTVEGVKHILTYGATYDPVVLAKHTTLAHSKHKELPVWHSGLLFKRSARACYINDCITAYTTTIGNSKY